jgi:hypothetical protein
MKMRGKCSSEKNWRSYQRLLTFWQQFLTTAFVIYMYIYEGNGLSWEKLVDVCCDNAPETSLGY